MFIGQEKYSVKKPIKIAFTGPESSGKTTLSMWLANELNGTYCPEYAREYLQDKQEYKEADLIEIAKGQINQWNQVDTKKSLIADTELFVVQIWSNWKYNSCDSFIIEEARKQDFDIYFLCKPDIPWEFDPLRESPEHREELFEIYRETLTKNKCSYFVIEGDIHTRKHLIKKALEIKGVVF
ncbi:MAG: hypothetical protein RLZ10_347 [Bacteroidota bacterium]